jgi:hypothetical protein
VKTQNLSFTLLDYLGNVEENNTVFGRLQGFSGMQRA